MTSEEMMDESSFSGIFPLMDCYEYLDILKDDPGISNEILDDKMLNGIISNPQSDSILNGDNLLHQDNQIRQDNGMQQSNPFYQGNQLHQENMMPLSDFSYIEDFSEQYLSDASLNDQHSPQTLYSPEIVGYGAQNSPGAGSTDSGIITSPSPSSPKLSSDTIDGSSEESKLKNIGSTLDAIGLPSLDGFGNGMQLQNQLVMKYLIEQEVQQVLMQCSKDQLQNLQQEVQLKQQQQLLALAQQQQRELSQCNDNQCIQSDSLDQQSVLQTVKADSQLRKMLQQTKHNIMNSLQDKKEKFQFKFHKSNNQKSGKRKMAGIPSHNEKAEKVLAIAIDDGLQQVDKSKEHSCDGSVKAEGNFAASNLSRTVSLQSSSQELSNLYQPSMAQMENKPSESIFIPQPTVKSNYVASSIASNTSSNPKVPITRLKPLSSSPPKYDSGGRKTRVEHVVIEKRYRMKITDSLNELKRMLSLDDEKKPTKNSILQAAIIELKRLKRENDMLSKKYDKMKKIFDKLRKVGILASNQEISSSSSESNISEVSSSNEEVCSDNVDPEVKQDHFVSPFQRQSARDGVKITTCFGLFFILWMNPLNLFASSNSTVASGVYSSRHLMSVGDQEPSPYFSLASNLINIILSLVVLMFMLLHGNPKCIKDSKITQCFRSQLTKAQKMINRHEYEEAKGFIRIALFVIGNSCPKTKYGQFASFLWKSISHLLYQLGILTTLESIGYAILPTALSLVDEKKDREYAARLSAEAYRKLHEIAMKDPDSTYLEAACYLMNTIYAAEVAGDHEALCTAYLTAVIHMKEKLWFSYFPQYYFTGCAHHVSLASKDGPFAVDWIFESRGYEYFTSGLWDVKKQSVFYVNKEDSEFQADLLQNVYAQFQEYLLMKSIKRIAVPERYYPNEGKIELRLRAKSLLTNLGTGPVSEQLDQISIYHQSLYGWWGCVLKQLIEVKKNGFIDVDDVKLGSDLFEEVNENQRHDIMIMTRAAISSYISTYDLKKQSGKFRLSEAELNHLCNRAEKMLLYASQLIEEKREVIKFNDEDGENSGNNDNEMLQLIYILCCGLVIEGNYMLWQINPRRRNSERLIENLLRENEILRFFSAKYPELELKTHQHDFEIQCLCGNNLSEMNHIMKRSRHIQSAHTKKEALNGIDMNWNSNPLKQDYFTGGF